MFTFVLSKLSSLQVGEGDWVKEFLWPPHLENGLQVGKQSLGSQVQISL